VVPDGAGAATLPVARRYKIGHDHFWKRALTVLAYWIVPVTMFFFWLRFLPGRIFGETLLHVFSHNTVRGDSDQCSLCGVTSAAAGDIRLPKSKNIVRMILGTTRAALACGLILFLFSLGVNRGLPFDHGTSGGESPADVRRWASMVFQSVGYRPYADVTEAALVTPPPRGEAWTDETVEGNRRREAESE